MNKALEPSAGQKWISTEELGAFREVVAVDPGIVYWENRKHRGASPAAEWHKWVRAHKPRPAVIRA